MIYFKKLVLSFRFAFEGIVYALRHNQNLRIHFVIAIIVVVLSVLFKVSSFEKGVLGVMILLVISSEMVNTSIEQMVDLITSEHRKEAKIAKDVSAGMVLIAALGSVIVGILIFAPHILKLFK